MRFLFPLATAAAITVFFACKGGPGTLDDGAAVDAPPGSSGGDEGIRTPPNPGSSGAVGSSGSAGTSGVDPVPPTQVRGRALDTASITKMSRTTSVCGAVGCFQYSAVVVDFAAKTVERRACSGGTDAGITTTTEPVTDEQLAALRSAATRLRIEPFNPDAGIAYDGKMESGSITNAAGEVAFSPQATCNHGAFEVVLEGWDEYGRGFSRL